MLLLLTVSPFTVGNVNSTGRKLQKALASRKNLLRLAQQSAFCRPAVRIVGGYLTWPKIFFGFAYLGSTFYFISSKSVN